MSYYLRGALNSGNSSFLVSPQGSYLYFATLVANAGGTGTNLIFDPRNPKNLGTGQTPAAPFVLTASNNFLTMSTNAGFVNVNTSSQATIVPSTGSPVQLTPTTSTAANFGLVLTGPIYTLTPNQSATPMSFMAYVPDPTLISNGFPTKILYDTSTPPQPQLQSISGIRFLPAVWYDSSKNCGYTSGDDAVTIEVQWFQGTFNDQGFTSPTECANGVFYNYCPAGTVCATSCMGPCTNPELTCQLSGSSSFVCEKPKTDTPFYKEWWFWLLVGVAVIIIIAIFIILIRDLN